MLKFRLNWHKLFGQILQARLSVLGFQVLTEYQVTKDPWRMDVVVIRPQHALSSEELQQLPDGIREHLKTHNFIDFKSISETYGIDQLDKTISYARAYLDQEKLSREELQTFAVSSMTPSHLLKSKEIPIFQESRGVYRLHLAIREVILLVPNELPDNEANAVLGIFASRKDRFRDASKYFLGSRFWSKLIGVMTFIYYRLGKEFDMSGWDLKRFEEEGLTVVLKNSAPDAVAKAFNEFDSQNKTQVLQGALSQLNKEELHGVLSQVDKADLEELLAVRQKE